MYPYAKAKAYLESISYKGKQYDFDFLLNACQQDKLLWNLSNEKKDDIPITYYRHYETDLFK